MDYTLHRQQVEQVWITLVTALCGWYVRNVCVATTDSLERDRADDSGTGKAEIGSEALWQFD